jgi:hypothetical protein
MHNASRLSSLNSVRPSASDKHRIVPNPFLLTMFFNKCILAVLICKFFVYAAVYTWDVTWVSRNPDGLHRRPVIGINGQWPPPALTADVGEKITIHLTNNLGNETTGLHFHGLFQNGSNSMDGPTGVTQCPIGPGETFTQVFTVSLSICSVFLTLECSITSTGESTWYLLVSLS